MTTAPTETDMADDSYTRALSAEPSLHAIERLVEALCQLVRPDDTMCGDCVWEQIVKPLATPLVGWERGMYSHAEDPDPKTPLRFYTGGELMKIHEEEERRRGEPRSATEAWMRTSEAWNAVANRWLARLNDADPANGHGIARVLP
jgi:hypothetical protein